MLELLMITTISILWSGALSFIMSRYDEPTAILILTFVVFPAIIYFTVGG